MAVSKSSIRKRRRSASIRFALVVVLDPLLVGFAGLYRPRGGLFGNWCGFVAITAIGSLLADLFVLALIRSLALLWCARRAPGWSTTKRRSAEQTLSAALLSGSGAEEETKGGTRGDDETPSSTTTPEERWRRAAVEGWSHVAFLELVYALAKGVLRALGTYAPRCDDVALGFDAACAAFAIFAFVGPSELERYYAACAESEDDDDDDDTAETDDDDDDDDLESVSGGPASEASFATSTAPNGAVALLSTPLLGNGDSASASSAVSPKKKRKKKTKKKATASSESKWRATVSGIAAVARPDLCLFCLAMCCAVIAALATSAISLWTGDALDDLINHGDGKKFRRRVSQLAAIAAVGAVTTGGRGGLFSLIGVRINVRIRDRLFRHLLTLELGFYDGTPTGDLNSRLSSDTSKIGDQVSLNVNVFARTGVQLVTTLAFMVHTSQPLTLVACACVPIVGVATKRYGEYVWSLSKAMQDKLAAAMKVAEEAFSSMLTVRSMAGEASVAIDFSAALRQYMAVGKRQALAYSAWQSFNTGLPNFVTCLVLYYGGRLVADGSLQSGRLVSFMLLTQSLADSFNTLADMFSNIADALGAADKVFDLLARDPDLDAGAPIDPFNPDSGGGDDSPGAGRVGSSPSLGRVELEDVHFKYPARPDVPVLRGVTLAVAPGTVVALVGPSGSGKSSVLSLVQRFYAPDAGAVRVDGEDVAHMPHASLHRRVALVGQNPVLFARSIQRNVLYALDGDGTSGSHSGGPSKKTPATNGHGGHAAPTAADVERVLRMAHAWKFVESLPQRLDTDVGERGVALSGGQAQRIAIARALARQPHILLLDEATSALDAESEHMVQSALDELIKASNMTVVVVAHRLSTIQAADAICCMRDGLIIEQGTHDALMSTPGSVYADLVRRQAALASSEKGTTSKEGAAAAANGEP